MNKVNKKEDITDEEMSLAPNIPSRNALVKQNADIDGFLIKRQEFIQKVSAICVEGKDYHIIQGKKSLAKGGAEKIASIFQWNSIFEKDTQSIEMLGDIKGLVCFKCTLSKGNKFVGEGRGAASLVKNSNDPNKTIKMAQKSAFIDAVLRSSGLSDFFTQDLEDMNIKDVSDNKNIISPSEKQLQLIQDMMDQKRVTPEVVYDMGFDLKHLTGGREGTASELISALKTYIPKYQVTVEINGLTSSANEMIGRLAQVKDPAELEELKLQLSKYRQEGRFTKEDIAELVKAFEKARKEIIPVEV